MTTNPPQRPTRNATIREIAILREQHRRRLIKDFHSFVVEAWPHIEPGRPFKDGWHIHELCIHAQALKDFIIPKLVVTMPPRHMKSSLFAVLFPAWVWADPNCTGRQFIYGSYSEAIAIRDSIKTRDLIQSDWYQKTIKPTWSLKEDQNQKKVFENTAGGKRIAVGVGSGLTGQGADHLFIDDPHNALQVHSEVSRENVKTWHDSTYASRYNDPKRYTTCIIQQRLHEDDLAGYLLLDSRYQHLCFQAKYRPPDHEDYIPSSTTLNPQDPRTELDQPLWPERFDNKALQDLALSLKGHAEGQLQQDPKPPAGGLFPRDQWQWYVKSPSPILEIVQFWDCAEKPSITSDFSVCATWAKSHNGFYLLDIYRGQIDAPTLEVMAQTNYQKWKPSALVIEDKSHGSSLIQYLLRNTTLPVIPYNPGKLSKELRAIAASPTIKAGKCHLPKVEDQSSEMAEVIKAFVKEHEKFPKGKNDDMVDTTSMMVSHFNDTLGTGPNIRVI